MIKLTKIFKEIKRFLQPLEIIKEFNSQHQEHLVWKINIGAKIFFKMPIINSGPVHIFEPDHALSKEGLTFNL